jgi:hypothetical protein
MGADGSHDVGRDTSNHIVQALQYVGVGKAQEVNPQRLDMPLTMLVVLRHARLIMTIPIYLDGQLELGAVKVKHVTADAVLSAKSTAEQLPITQSEPQASFGGRAMIP